MHWSTQHIQNRCVKLANYGLIKNLGRGVYQITEDGVAYLDEALDASQLPEPES